MGYTEDRIKELEDELSRYKKMKESEESDRDVKEFIETLRKKYIGKPVYINNEEDGGYWIFKVVDVISDGEEVTLVGPGIRENCQEAVIDFNMWNDGDEIEGAVFYSNPEHYKIDNWVTVFKSIDDLKKDVLERVKDWLDLCYSGTDETYYDSIIGDRGNGVRVEVFKLSKD